MKKEYIVSAISFGFGLVGLIRGTFFTAQTPREKIIEFILSVLFIGVVPLVVYIYKSRQIKRQVIGDFEWQWAGENLISKMSITDRDGKQFAKLKQFRIRSQPGDGQTILERKFLFETDEGVVQGNNRGFSLDLSVNQYQANTDLSKLVAKVHPVEAYAGICKYVNKKGIEVTGDIIFVKYLSAIHAS
jgi:hypothetical protein